MARPRQLSFNEYRMNGECQCHERAVTGQIWAKFQQEILDYRGQAWRRSQILTWLSVYALGINNPADGMRGYNTKPNM